MKVIYGINHIRATKKPVVALGVFDGVHIGHRAILRCSVKKARALGVESMVITFWPHPGAEKSLYSLEHRLRLIKELGVDSCVVIRFTKIFSGISAPDFVKKILCEKVGARFIYVGENFRFGKGASGTARTLGELSGECGFVLEVCPVIKNEGKPVSSTRIRNYITKGELAKARKLLGRPVSILGTVMHGAALGRAWGVPTANINPHHEIMPPSGVYAAVVYLQDKRFTGICYIGEPPRFLRGKKLKTSAVNIEVHIFDFHKDIYDRNIEIQFLRKLRDRMEFSNLNELISQINKDIKKTRQLTNP